ncbi:Eco57I restriction-modification methylase domain-containing protein [Bradyrhizobium sp. HKCCYLR20261]|uniref:Eco57I restriction-modification methylase domain-containing protein n=1 Tax=Bradyrhizobium sp. HKCCYLR20261 TaxID=3420760 RepID=UPI003EBBFEEF
MSAAAAMERAPWALVHDGEFFAWARATAERFDCAAGNPPFIRYQTFNGAVRERALGLCRSLGAEFSGLTSSWAPFLVATASLLKRGGRMAFIVPAEIGHAPYAAPLLDYLVESFATVQVVAVREKLFPELSEDCWLLFAEGYGGQATHIMFTAVDSFRPGSPVPRHGERVEVHEWRNVWNRRLRPLLLPREARALYRMAAEDPGSRRFGSIANAGIGYVSGANNFFHLRPSDAERWNIPTALLFPTVRNAKALPQRRLTHATIETWRKADAPTMLLRLPKTNNIQLPAAVRRYLDSDAGMEARKAFKCRVRDPWYSVPDVRTPDYFLAYMSGRTAGLVRNLAGATCTNSVHGVSVLDKPAMSRAVKNWDSAFVAVSREIEGHPLGGGMLKLEPGEASRILIPSEELFPQLENSVMADAVSTMRRWRHYAGQ